MENASRAVVEEVVRLRSESRPGGLDRIEILCGPGNNGGDGVAVARLLAAEGISNRCHLVAPPREGSDLEAQVSIARGLGMALHEDAPGEEVIAGADLFIDALFGTGLSRPLQGPLAELVAQLNRASAPVVAVDLPSGLDADRGVLIGPAVRAERTVTFPYPKLAHCLFPAAAECGRVVVRGLGVPSSGWRPADDGEGRCVETIEREAVRRQLPERVAHAHKGTYGRVLVVAGSRGLEGAAVLAASSAVAGGAGLVRLLVPAACRASLQVRPEVMVAGVGGEDSGHFVPEDLLEVARVAKDQDAVVLGPGLGESLQTQRFVSGLIEECEGALILDADALRVFGPKGGPERVGSAPPILTPHPGEMARMFERPVETIVADPIASAREAAERWRAVVVLKGRPTVVAAPEGEVWINPTGGPLLASGGSGDVLAGLVGALAAANADAASAARCGVFVHGLGADRLTARRSRVGLGAAAISAELPEALEACYREVELDGIRVDPEPQGVA